MREVDAGIKERSGGPGGGSFGRLDRVSVRVLGCGYDNPPAKT
jgi:hypothetical protein